MILIHPTAIIEPSVELGKNVKVGPYCVITGNVTLGDNVELKSHIVIANKTSIGDGTVIFPFASIGHSPQDLKYQGEDSELIIGSNNIIREHVTINPGTLGGGMKTVIGNNCLIMISAHIAHDCIIGNNVILANNVTLGGHVTVDDFAIIGGMSGVRQFIRIGSNAMIGGMSGVDNDVIPFALVSGERSGLIGVNIVGLKRKGFDKEEINALRDAYEILFNNSNENNFASLVEDVKKKYPELKSVQKVVEFLKSENSNGICKPKSKNDQA
jgi:UDP-N-acetylglucosamine acyltransferase